MGEHSDDNGEVRTGLQIINDQRNFFSGIHDSQLWASHNPISRSIRWYTPLSTQWFICSLAGSSVLRGVEVPIQYVPQRYLTRFSSCVAISGK